MAHGHVRECVCFLHTCPTHVQCPIPIIRLLCLGVILIFLGLSKRVSFTVLVRYCGITDTTSVDLVSLTKIADSFGIKMVKSVICMAIIPFVGL